MMSFAYNRLALAVLSFVIGLMAYILLTAHLVALLQWHRIVLGGTLAFTWFNSFVWLRDAWRSA
jgi:hypothetical protein